MNAEDRVRKLGSFELCGLGEVFGELTLDGSDSSLDLYSPTDFEASAEDIFGILFDRTKVSLLQCVSSGSEYSIKSGESFFHHKFFPHTILFGDRQLGSHASEVSAVNFTVDDAPAIFHDRDAFRMMRNARPELERIARERNEEGKVKLGDHPQVFYFTGKQDVLSGATSVGTVTVHHAVSGTLPSPKGFSLRDSIRIDVAFDKNRTVIEAKYVVLDLLRFFAVIAGRSQNLGDLRLTLFTPPDHRPCFLDVYWPLQPRRTEDEQVEPPNYWDLPLQAAAEPELFSQILSAWLARQDHWRSARSRFAEASRLGRLYNVDRLVGAANMFDILPDDAYAPPASLPLELTAARDAARTAFRALPSSPERDSILGALGRIGSLTLKRKLRQRAALVSTRVSDVLPELELVCDQAVDCRNFYVHGSMAKLDYERHRELRSFFTDTLEFIFAASDLQECGWDSRRVAQNTSMSHPFGRFRVDYRDRLANLKRILGSSKP